MFKFKNVLVYLTRGILSKHFKNPASKSHGDVKVEYYSSNNWLWIVLN